MSAIQSQASSSAKFTSLPFSRIPAVGIFFLILFIVLVTGIFVYMMLKLFRTKNSSKELSLPTKFIPADDFEAMVAIAKSLSVTDQEQVVVYKIGANGVKKGIRITLSGLTSDVGHGESMSHTAQDRVTSSQTSPSSAVEELKCSASFSATLTSTMASISRNVADLKTDPKLFPVQGPLRSLDTTHAPPPPVNGNPLHLLSRPPATAHVHSKKRLQPSIVAFSAPDSVHITAAWNTAVMNQNPKLFPVQGPVKPLDTEIQFPARAQTLGTIVHNYRFRPEYTRPFDVAISSAKDSRFAPPVAKTVSIRNMPYIKSIPSTKTSADVDLYENKSPRDSSRYTVKPAKSTHRILADVSSVNWFMNPPSWSAVASRISQGTMAKSSFSVRQSCSREAPRHSDHKHAPSRTVPSGKENAPLNQSIQAS